MKQIADMSIMLTEACNLKCSFCYEKPASTVMMSNETVEKCVDWMVERRNPARSHIMWFGGEPLLNWQTLFHGLSYAKAKLPKETLCNIVMTNATLWNEKIKQKFMEHPDLEIQISWQGLPELQDADRGMSGLVEQNIREMVAMLPNKIHVQMQLLPATVDRIVDATDYIAATVGDNGGFIVLRPVPEMEGWNDETLNVLEEQLRIVFAKYGKRIKKLLDCHRGFDMEGLFCTPGSGFCSFSPSGDIYPCHRFYFSRKVKFKLGNVYTGITKTKVSRMLDEVHRYSIAGCEGCKAEKHCFICPACNYEQTGNPLISSDEVCRVNKAYGGIVAEYVAKYLTLKPEQFKVAIPDEFDMKSVLPQLLEVISNLNDQVGVLTKKCRNLESQMKFKNRDW